MDIKLMPEKYKKRGESPVELSVSGFLSKLALATNLWLILFVSFLILVILACFGLWGYKNSLNEEAENLEKRFEELVGQRDLEAEANFIELKEGIENFKKFLNSRLYPSNLFEMLEELTLPQVQFTDLDANLPQAMIILEIEVIDYHTLAKQIVAFEEDERIKKIEFSEVNLETSGQVGSSLSIELNPDFLHSE